MLELADIRDWLKTIDSEAENFYIGKLDNKKEKSIGVYQLRTSNPPDIALGGQNVTKTLTKNISILIHWNKNAKQTEAEALDLFKKLINAESFYIKNIKINYIRMLVHEPVDVGTDENNVYERVIEASFYYEKGE